MVRLTSTQSTPITKAALLYFGLNKAMTGQRNKATSKLARREELPEPLSFTLFAYKTIRTKREMRERERSTNLRVDDKLSLSRVLNVRKLHSAHEELNLRSIHKRRACELNVHLKRDEKRTQTGDLLPTGKISEVTERTDE